MRRANSRSLAFGAVTALALALPAASVAQAPVDFSRDVRPVLSDNCFACHGPDEAARQADLRLDTPEGAFADRDGRPAIVPGSPEDSLLYERMSHPQEVARMPPPGAERRPTEEEVETVRRWIEQGAEWETHWAYHKPERPEPPAVENPTWARNPIDRFVLAKLEGEGLEPSPEADKRTLLRRLSFDITGLPPTPEEVRAFVEDSSPDAYEKQIDRLLASKRYGERMAMQWLDLARYADTHGYHIDGRRDMWLWRDWVIRAFNDNKPYDEFTIEQLAGDLLPDPTEDQIIATGFNRNHMINHEGGAIPEEYHVEYVVDRVDTTATVWMAMTMGCARCHDHKYDPITQRDFYRFFAFFNSIDEKGLDGVRGNASPALEIPGERQERRLAAIETEVDELERTLDDERIAARIADWQKDARRTLPTDDADGLVAHYEMEGGFVDSSGHYRHGRVLRGDPLFPSGPAGRGASFDVDTHVEFPGTESIDLSEPFTIAFWMRHSGLVEKTLLHKMDDPDSRRGLELRLTAPDPIPDALRREFDLIVRLSSSPDDAIVVKTGLYDEVGRDNTYHITLAYDGSGKASGFRFYLNGEAAEAQVVKDALTADPNVDRPFEIGAGRFGGRYTGVLDELRLYSRVIEPGDLETLYVHEPIRALLGRPALDCDAILAAAPEPPEDDIYAPDTDDDVSRCKSRRARLRDYYLSHVAPASDRQAYARLQDLEREKKELEEEIPDVMVMRELSEPRDTHVLARGDYRNPTEKVEPGAPAWLNPFPPDAPRNRLGLARWLVSPEHPLTARVAVNRFWQMYFGAGLVRTSEDFGSQGEEPTHRKLLDWLAVELMQNDWNVKALQKKILMSATYRQSSRVSPELLDRDPENRLLARGPRFRLPAELVRDNALAVSGLLNDEMGGPGVFPYQPKGIWKEMSYGDWFTAQVYRPSSGEDLYRRSLYSFWKRTAPPPGLAVFDAPDREKCAARRPRTNTPLQALTLLNDTTYVEASRAFAEKILLDAGDDPGERVRFAFLRALARPPQARESEVLVDLARTERERFEADPERARKLVAVGDSRPDERLEPVELAAWTTVASSILNLDEMITKE